MNLNIIKFIGLIIVLQKFYKIDEKINVGDIVKYSENILKHYLVKRNYGIVVCDDKDANLYSILWFDFGTIFNYNIHFLEKI